MLVSTISSKICIINEFLGPVLKKPELGVDYYHLRVDDFEKVLFLRVEFWVVQMYTLSEHYFGYIGKRYLEGTCYRSKRQPDGGQYPSPGYTKSPPGFKYHDM